MEALRSYRMRLGQTFSLAVIGLTLAFAGSEAIAKKRTSVPTEPAPVARRYVAELDAMRLKPGGYVWYADRAAGTGPVEMVMSLKQQRVWVFRAGQLLGMATISSGTKGRESPYGRFQILEKKLLHRSIRYDNAPMPHMMRLNWYGVAMHGGHVPGYPASHGCFRLPPAFAQKLYATAPVGSFVYVSYDAVPFMPEEALELARGNYGADMPVDRLPRGTEFASTYAEQEPAEPVSAAYAEQAAPDPAPPRTRRRQPQPRSSSGLRGFFGRIF